jgi:exopolysaccharide production protein ExoY
MDSFRLRRSGFRQTLKEGLMSTHVSSEDSPLAFSPAPALASPALVYDPQFSRARQFGLALKRGVDVVGALISLLFLSPILPLLALIVRLDGGPALYGHTRIGCNGRPFKCLKFRTMVVDADKMLANYLATHPRAAMEWARQQKLQHDPRVTRIGAILRKTSIDELPQLINVLRGEMSLVGPRPVVHDELEEHYGPIGQTAYSAMRPGITGLWQVSGRSDTTYRERVMLDITYRSSWSLLLDLKILLRTVPVVLGRRGAV